MSGNNKQIFGKPVNEVIRARSSVRTYKNQQPDPVLIEELNSYMVNLRGPFGVKARLKLIDSRAALSDSGIKLGTYGIIRGASSFVAGAVGKAEKSLEELGYMMESLILYATSLGLGTCWLGGTFKKGEFAKAMELKNDEILPAITPVGYPKESRSPIDSLMRFVAGSKYRKEWKELFFDGGFEKVLNAEAAGSYSVPLEMVRLGPSASNKQPWRIVKDNAGYRFYLQHTKGYSSALGFDMQRLDIGIAMCHFELTAKELNLDGSWLVEAPGLGNIPENTEYIVSWICK